MSDSTVDDKFDPMPMATLRDELSDGNLVAGQLSRLAEEMRVGFEMVNQKLLPLIERFTQEIDDLKFEQRRLERDHADEVRERKRLAERVDALESRAKPQRPKRARK